jgi:hypothetical protein
MGQSFLVYPYSERAELLRARRAEGYEVLAASLTTRKPTL